MMDAAQQRSGHAEMREQLLERYRALDSSEQRVLQALSVGYGAVSVRVLVAACRRGALRRVKGKEITEQRVRALLDGLAAEGLCVRDEQREDAFACHRLIIEDIDADGGAELNAGLAPAVIAEVAGDLGGRGRGYDDVMRELRFALRSDNGRARALLGELARRDPDRFADVPPLALACDRPLRFELIGQLAPGLRADAVDAIVRLRAARLEPLDDVLASFGGLLRPERRGMAALVRGELAGEVSRDPWTAAAALFLRGDVAAGLAGFDAQLKAWRRIEGQRTLFRADQLGVWHLFARLAVGGTKHGKRVLQDVGAALAVPGRRSHLALGGLEATARARLGERDRALATLRYHLAREQPGHDDGEPDAFFSYFAFAACQVDAELIAVSAPVLEMVAQRAERNGYALSALVAIAALERMSRATSHHRAQASAICERTGLASWSERPAVDERWRKALPALVAIGRASQGTEREHKKRLVWLLTVVDERRVWFEPREQSRGKAGWTGGRRVAVERLFKEHARLEHLTPQDHEMCGCIGAQRVGYYGQVDYTIDHEAMLAAAVGHPLLFLADDVTQALQIVRRDRELEVHERDGAIELALVPRTGARALHVSIESRTRIVVTPATDAHRQIDRLLDGKLTVPATARQAVHEALGELAAVVTVRSNLEAGDLRSDAVPADGAIRARLRPEGDGFRLTLRVKPLGDGGPLYRPGAGGRTVLASVDGRALSTTRDLDGEREAAWEIAAACPLPDDVDDTAAFSWPIASAESCLELLLALDDLEGGVVIEWPEGEKLPPPRRAATADFRVSVRVDGSFFDIGAEIPIDEERVLTLTMLIELIAKSRGRFIELGRGEFLALTSALRRRIALLARLGEPRGEGIRVGRAAAMAIHEVVGDLLGGARSRRFVELVKRLRAGHEEATEAPATLCATLRPYQREGYAWASRLAALGFGACLADDMGLGKTVQALAVLVERAPGGPALIVAPTSVCFGWEAEAARFAPTLCVRRLSRDEDLAALGPFDVVVASYGQLYSDRARVNGIDWHTLIVDEAQAIKNPAAKRTQAVMAVSAEFRMATTGTPIENHLGELWSVMSLLNPGLLGSRRQFDARFASPIEGDGDDVARHALRALIRPFILRRSKVDVLTELPARTDVTVAIELSADERAFYEALRRRALAAIEASKPAERRFRVLAELTALRRAACDPELVTPNCGVASSKLAAFEERVTALIEGGHKALVFSQFVTYLERVRARLDALGVRYQYLDGSTPSAERAARVAAFQGGEGDLFLISLRAGGTGLNLTAADYVLHLDPWWNPAVEDQASDRAYRIGQTRPVTVYRFVAQATIEERIVTLHRDKRALAEALLEGTDTPKALDLDTLTALLRE